MHNQQTQKHFIVAVVGARLTKKRRLGLGTWLRMRNAAKLGKSLRRNGVPFQYVIVPDVAASNAESRMRLLLALSTFDDGYQEALIMPDMGHVVPRKEQVTFARTAAERRGSSLVLAGML